MTARQNRIRGPWHVTMLRGMLLMLTAGNAEAASTDIYRCQQNGRIQFSDRPCDANSTPLSIPASQPSLISATSQANQASRDRASVTGALHAAEQQIARDDAVQQRTLAREAATMQRCKALRSRANLALEAEQRRPGRGWEKLHAKREKLALRYQSTCAKSEPLR